MISRHTRKLGVQAAKTVFAHARSCTTGNQIDQEPDKIQLYETERDENSVAEIVLKNMVKLTSEVRFKEDLQTKKLVPCNSLELLHERIMPAINKGSSTTTKVYLLNGKAVGFINYCIYEPFIPSPFGPNAIINFLAVDDQYQGIGIGTALLEDALKDCQNQSVCYIELSTTGFTWFDGKPLHYFYLKFGFSAIGDSRYTGVTKYKKRLKPHSIILISKAVFEWIQKFRE